jgi:hypothetical protein
VGNEYFESVNLATQAVTDIGYGSHDFAFAGVGALGYSSDTGEMVLTDVDAGPGNQPTYWSQSTLYKINVATGEVALCGLVGGGGVVVKGLAFGEEADCGGGGGAAAGTGQLAFFWSVCLFWLNATKVRNRRSA